MKRTMTKRRFLIMLRHMGACERGIRHVEKFASPREAYERARTIDAQWLVSRAAEMIMDGYGISVLDQQARDEIFDIYSPNARYWRKGLFEAFPWSRVEKMLFERAKADGVKL